MFREKKYMIQKGAAKNVKILFNFSNFGVMGLPAWRDGWGPRAPWSVTWWRGTCRWGATPGSSRYPPSRRWGAAPGSLQHNNINMIVSARYIYTIKIYIYFIYFILKWYPPVFPIRDVLIRVPIFESVQRITQADPAPDPTLVIFGF